MEPIEERLGVEDLLRWVPLADIDACVVVYGHENGFLTAGDIVKVELARLVSDAPVGPVEERIALLLRDEEADSVRMIHEMTPNAPCEERGAQVWFDVGMLELGANWPNDTVGESLISLLVDRFGMRDAVPDLLYWGRSSRAELTRSWIRPRFKVPIRQRFNAYLEQISFAPPAPRNGDVTEDDDF